jgi:hypothetical protein
MATEASSILSTGRRLPFPSFGLIVTPVKTGVHPIPLTWIPFSNGMTDAVVRHLDTRREFILSGKSKGRHDELN